MKVNKINAPTLALCLALLMGVAALWTSLADASGNRATPPASSAPAAEQGRWEYSIYKTGSPDAAVSKADTMGNQGWELVSVTRDPANDGNLWFIFKRPR